MNIIDDSFSAGSVQAEQMDFLWAGGWRHFGEYFFRYSVALRGERLCRVIPLRIELSRFTPSRSQKRILSRNRDVRVVIRDTVIDAAKEALFERHRKRFTENVPDSLYTFLAQQPASVPCHNQEICVYSADRLLAASFLDIGATATSAVYAMFEPAEHKRSLGVFTILRAIEHSCQLRRRYYYHGYAYREPSAYDYKKNFEGLEYLQWGSDWKRATPSSITL